MSYDIATNESGRHCRYILLLTASLVVQNGHGFAPIISSAFWTTKRTVLAGTGRAATTTDPSRRAVPLRRCTSRRNNLVIHRAKSDTDGSDDGPFSRVSAELDKGHPLTFSIAMALAGATLGPFLDSYHSAFGVLKYDSPIHLKLWGSDNQSALITCWWVPLLFGVAGWLIGWLYILYDAALSPPSAITSKSQTAVTPTKPSIPKILLGISFFTFQYWISGLLAAYGVDRTTIFAVMSALAAVGFVGLDMTFSGFLVSASTAIGGPLIEAALLNMARMGSMGEYGYHYTDAGETGYFPLWIAPVYFLGGPAVGNLARGIWNALEISPADNDSETVSAKAPCEVCGDSRQIPCPNCDGVGTYVAISTRAVTCTSCQGRGFVICRACFDRYDEDPYDIDAIRELMSRMPD